MIYIQRSRGYTSRESLSVEKIEKLVKDYSAKMGKELSIKRFTRFEMGEGLEKRSDDFAAEVEAQMKK